MNKQQAVETWVSFLNNVPKDIIERLYLEGEGQLEEINQLYKGLYVRIGHLNVSGHIVSVDTENKTVTVDIDGTEIKTHVHNIIDERDPLPSWETLWMFNNQFELKWVSQNIETLNELGFRVYEDSEKGHVFIGIDGGGYDFFEKHWEPLYDAMGLSWHDCSHP